jgi:hypothetical protein
MTPSPEKKKILQKFNKKMMGSNVERTVEKHSQSQSYRRERNGSEHDGREEGEEKGGGVEEEDEDREGDFGEEEEEDEGEGEENDEGEGEGEEEGDSDDECSIGALNLSNHDINDDDEVLQSIPDYHTPENNNKNKNKNKASNANSLKISTKNTTVKTPQKNLKMNDRVSSPFLTGRAVTQTPEKQTFLQQNLSNKIGGKGAYKMAKLPIKNRKIEKEKEKNDMTRTPDRVKNACAAAVPGIGMGGGRLVSECRFMAGVRDEEMREITAQIRTLNAELKYFEELTGKRCIFGTTVSRDKR